MQLSSPYPGGAMHESVRWPSDPRPRNPKRAATGHDPDGPLVDLVQQARPGGGPRDHGVRSETGRGAAAVADAVRDRHDARRDRPAAHPPMGRGQSAAMITALVIALTTFVVYAFLAILAPDLARDLGVPYAAVMVTACAVLSR